MDKIQIKGLMQGTVKLKGDTYAIGFRTVWGIAWLAPIRFGRSLIQNRHLAEYVNDRLIDERDLIGRYIYVANKRQQVVRGGTICDTIRLFKN